MLAAQPNYIRRITAAPPPNDFLWVNDTANGFYGLKKIQADLVWAAPHNTTGSSAVVIADIDTGVKYTHPDLAANMWINPGEIAGNLIDDDANGYVDDVHGINALTHSGNPMDDHGHGTHTAGTFGAVGNNGPDFADRHRHRRRELDGADPRLQVPGCRRQRQRRRRDRVPQLHHRAQEPRREHPRQQQQLGQRARHARRFRSC